MFLASIREFNPDFQFLILDDVVSSFDIMKRPKVIKLLRDHFDDFQILILTHDVIWRDQLYRSFPGWVRREFYNFTYQTGPCIKGGMITTDRISDLCKENHADEAASKLGVYMELRLQEICEGFEVMMKYKQKSDHYLTDFLERLKVRSNDKLGESHPFTIALHRVIEDSIFRNFSAHWKNPPTPYSSSEIIAILEQWLKVENMAYCGSKKCMEVLRYKSNSGIFICDCGQTQLKK